MENSTEDPQKIKHRTTIWPSNYTNGKVFKGSKNTNSKRYLQLYVHNCTIYKGQDMEMTKVSIDGWMDKEVAGWEFEMGNAIKLGCDDHCTTVNVIKFTELKKKKHLRSTQKK